MAIINCYDVNGDAIRFLTQWDHDISIRATGVKTSPTPEFRFSNKHSQKSKCICGVVVGDGVKATIPNGFLQEALPIYVQLFYTYPSGDAKTEHTFVIPVKPSSMPDGAVYEPVEVRSIVELEKRVKALEENGAPGAGGVPSDPSFDTVSLGGDAGVVIIPEGTADAPAITFYGARGDEPVALNNVADAIDDRSAPNLGQVKQLVEAHSGQNLSLDTTLTKSGEAADAKATGDEIKRVEKKIPSIEGLANKEDIPTKPEDIGAQPQGDYLTKAPVESVNGKTGAVRLGAADVGARPDTWMPTAQEVRALPDTYTPPNQTAEQVGADPKGTAAAAVSDHNANNEAHGDIRQELAAINARLTAFFDSDNQTLDELSEIVAYITSNKSLIDSITTSKVSVADIVNNLTTNVANKPLSAAQGVALKALIDGLSASLSNYQPKGNYALSTAVPTKVSQLANDKGYLTEHQDISHLTPTVKAVTKTEYSALPPDDVAQLYADGIRMIIVEDGYTNLVPKSTDAAGNVYRGCGYLDGYRLTSSGGLTASDNCCVSGFMPYVHGSTYRIVGSCGNALSNAGQYVGLYDANYDIIKIEYASSVKATWEPRADGLWEMTIDTSKISAWSSAKYFRVSCALCVGADLKVTRNEPIGLEV